MNLQPKIKQGFALRFLSQSEQSYRRKDASETYFTGLSSWSSTPHHGKGYAFG